MATPFYLRCGEGKFNYLSHDLIKNTWEYAGPGYNVPGVNTTIYTRRQWRELFPEQYRLGRLERVTGKEAREWRKRYESERLKSTLNRW